MAVKPSEVAQVLESAWNARDSIVPCLIGAPGIGKTQGVYEFAEKHGSKVVEIIASQILPNEVSGITMPVAKTHSMEIYDHARLASLKDGDILFFDELLQAAPQTLSACLTLILERRMMSGKKLPDIMVIAAANPLHSATQVPLSIRQRFKFIDVKFDSREWSKYISSKFGVTPTKQLISLIKTDGDQYNVLTPRTATELIEWGIKSDLDQGWRTGVNQMFDDYTAQCIVDTIDNKAKKPIEEQVAEVIKGTLTEDEMDLDTLALLEDLPTMTPKDMLERLGKLSNWEKIKEALECINLE